VQQLEVQRTQLDYHEAVHYATTAARRHTEALEARITRLHDDVSLARTATKRHAVALERMVPTMNRPPTSSQTIAQAWAGFRTRDANMHDTTDKYLTPAKPVGDHPC